jgi:predicted phage-related endonuclease
VDFFGNEVESLRELNLVTQRSTGRLESVHIPPRPTGARHASQAAKTLHDQLEATGRPCSIVLAILGGNRMQEYTVWRDTERGAKIMSAMDYFWQNCQNGIRPPVDDSESTAKTLGMLHPPGQPSVDREMTPEMAKAAREFLRAHARAKRAEEIEKIALSRKNLAANTLRELMGDTTSAVGEGVKVTWNTQDTKVVDAEAMAADTELAEAQKTVARLKAKHEGKRPIRVLRVTEPKPKK